MIVEQSVPVLDEYKYTFLLALYQGVECLSHRYTHLQL